MRVPSLPVAAVSIAAFALVAPISVAAADQTPASLAIRQAMEASAAGWNAGDLDRFMAIYADDAVFVTPKGLLRGKTAIAAKYRPSFIGPSLRGPSSRGQGNARGRLSFAFLDLRGIDPAHAVLFARWTLTGATTSETGMTTLVFERWGGAWKIIADHSS